MRNSTQSTCNCSPNAVSTLTLERRGFGLKDEANLVSRVPSSQYVEWALKASEAGKHVVLVEKPIALHAREIDPPIDAAKRNNVLISEAYMVTYHPQWEKVRELIAEGAIGRAGFVLLLHRRRQ